MDDKNFYRWIGFEAARNRIGSAIRERKDIPLDLRLSLLIDVLGVRDAEAALSKSQQSVSEPGA